MVQLVSPSRLANPSSTTASEYRSFTFFFFDLLFFFFYCLLHPGWSVLDLMSIYYTTMSFSLSLYLLGMVFGLVQKIGKWFGVGVTSTTIFIATDTEALCCYFRTGLAIVGGKLDGTLFSFMFLFLLCTFSCERHEAARVSQGSAEVCLVSFRVLVALAQNFLPSFFQCLFDTSKRKKGFLHWFIGCKKEISSWKAANGAM